jgi:hypothetical protein
MSKTIIEVNGVKLEVDLRHAKRVDELRVGDRVKVLTKGYSDYSVHAGTIVGFEPFAKLPTIIVAYVEKSYQKAEIKFVHFNAQTKDVELVKAIDDDAIDIDKMNVIQQLDAEVARLRDQIAEVERRKQYFLDNFKAYWERIPAPAEATEF